MKLNVGETEAVVYATAFASFFVIAVYIWKPLVSTPPEIHKIMLKKYEHVRQNDEAVIQEYETRMRTMSVGTLVVLSTLFLIARADLDQREEVGILQWFGMQPTFQAIRQTAKVILLNSLLFAGEIYQIASGMVTIPHELSFTTYKNLVIAPFFEELIYRVCLFNLFLESGALSQRSCVLLLPLYFGISHLHQIFHQQRSIKKRNEARRRANPP